MAEGFGLHTDRMENNEANLLLYHSRRRFWSSRNFYYRHESAPFGPCSFPRSRGRMSDGGERNNPLNLSSFSSSSLEGGREETFTSIMIVLLGSAEIGARWQITPIASHPTLWPRIIRWQSWTIFALFLSGDAP